MPANGKVVRNDDWSAFRSWLRRNKLPRSSNKLTLAEFSDTGRGLLATNDVGPGSAVVEIPWSILLTKAHIAQYFLDVNLLYQSLTEIQILSMFIYLLYDGANPLLPAAVMDFWQPYLNVLPKKFETVGGMIPPEIVEKFPVFVQDEINVQKNKLEKDWAQVKKFLLRVIKLRSVNFKSQDYPSPSLFRHAWYCVQTRCVALIVPSLSSRTCSNSISTSPETPFPSISLIPFLDMLNHDPSAEVKLFFDTSDMRFKTITAVPLERGQQVFISYGKHDNWRLLVEYGFIVDPKLSQLSLVNNTSNRDNVLGYEPTDKFRRLTPINIDSWIRTILLSDLKSHCSNHPSSSRRSSCLDLFLTYSKLTLLSESGYMSDYTFHSTPSYRCFMALALLLFPYFNGTPEMADMSRRLENVQNTDAFRAVQSKVEQIIKRWGGSESIILNNGDDNWTRTKPVDSEMVAISHTSSSGVQKELKASSLLKSLNSWFFNHEFTVLWKNSISGRIPAFNNLQSQSGKAQESVRLHLERVKNWIKNSTKVVLDARKQYSNFYKQLHPEINSGHWNWKVDDVAVSHFSFTQSLKSNVLDVVSDVSDLAEVVSHNINPYLLHCVDVIWSSELQVLEGIVSGDWDYDDLI